MPRRLTRDEEIARFFEEMELAPAGKEISYTAAANARADELEATGRVTMKQLETFGVVSRKTILKHIAAGDLVGKKTRVRGVETWLFQPEHAKDYLSRVVALTSAAVRTRANRPQRVAPPAGFLTIAGVGELAGVSRWTVHDAVAGGELPVGRIGPHGVKWIARGEAERFAAANIGRGRPYRRDQPREPSGARPHPTEHRRITISNRMVLLWLILDQPFETAGALAADIGVGVATLRRWSDGKSQPDDLNAGRLVRYARGRYRLEIGGELKDLSEQAARERNTVKARRRNVEKPSPLGKPRGPRRM